MGSDPDGRLIRRSVSARTRTEVVDKLKAIGRQVDDGLQAPDTQMTVGQLLDRGYSDVLRHQVAPNAAENHRSIADNDIRPLLGRMKVAKLAPADVDRLISQKIDAGLGASTVKRIRSLVVQALDQAVRRGSVNRNVAQITGSPKEQRREGREWVHYPGSGNAGWAAKNAQMTAVASRSLDGASVPRMSWRSGWSALPGHW